MDGLSVFLALAVALVIVVATIQFMSWFTGVSGTKGGVSRELDTRLDRLAQLAERTEKSLRDEHHDMRKASEASARALREEVSEGITRFGGAVQTSITEGRSSTDRKLEDFSRTHAEFADRLRTEMRQAMGTFSESLKADVKVLNETNAAAQETLRLAVTERLDRLRTENEAKLESIRATVEEKLQGTLEKRLGESFSLVSDRLEQVHKGLGEMQTLAIGVGDLKRIMSNVKDRGGWAEIQLGAMLEQMLARDQFVTNAKMETGASEMVEFAVRMPGQAGGGEVLLPIDAKFPKEDYERLVTAWESGDAEAARAASDALSAVFENEAKRISTKYIRPPYTTDFAVMYVPTEGLFAEAMRAAGLAQKLQAKYRVTIAGPSTLHALLNSLQMGFRTLAIQKRSGEVWRVLGEAKAEFQRYADVWEKLSKQLQTAQNTIQDAGVRSRAVERKLKDVETRDLPGGSQIALELAAEAADADASDDGPPRMQ